MPLPSISTKNHPSITILCVFANFRSASKILRKRNFTLELSRGRKKLFFFQTLVIGIAGEWRCVTRIWSDPGNRWAISEICKFKICHFFILENLTLIYQFWSLVKFFNIQKERIYTWLRQGRVISMSGKSPFHPQISVRNL